MTFGRVFGVLVFLSLTAAGSAFARDISSGTAGEKGNKATLVKGDKVAKGDKLSAKSGQGPAQGPASVRHVKPQVPIVMGRSVSEHYKTKLHHVKMKPLDSIDTPVTAEGSH
jgi:hypothetical protein